VAFLDHVPKRRAIVRVLGHGFAEVPALTGPVIDDKCEVVCCDGASNCGPAFLDGLDRCTGGSVLEDDTEVGEGCVDFEEVGEELDFSVEDVDVGGGVGGNFAVEVKDHAGLFHCGEDGVVGFVGFDASVRVGCDAAGV